MSELSTFNAQFRVDAIKALMVNNPGLLKQILNESGDSINLEATPEALDLFEPESILACLAWDIWNGSGETEFDAVLSQLPMDDFLAFIEAMKILAQLRAKIHHAYASGAEND